MAIACGPMPGLIRGAGRLFGPPLGLSAQRGGRRAAAMRLHVRPAAARWAGRLSGRRRPPAEYMCILGAAAARRPLGLMARRSPAIAGGA